MTIMPVQTKSSSELTAETSATVPSGVISDPHPADNHYEELL